MEVIWINGSMAVGTAIGTADNVRSLVECGVTHIINLQEEFDDRAIVGDLPVEICWLRTTGAPDLAMLRQARRFADQALDSDSGKLLVHCMAGRNRSPKLAYAVLVWRGVARAEARRLVLDAIPDAMVEEDDLVEFDALLAELAA